MSEHERHLCENCLREEYHDFQHECFHEAMDLNKSWTEKYGIGSWPRWDYSMDDASLTFSSDGVVKVFCEMQVVGSVKGDTWQWSWGNPHTPEVCKTSMSAVRDFGEEKQWDRLTTLFLDNTEYVGWECASVARHILGGKGVYRCPTSDAPAPAEGKGIDAVYLVILSCEFVN